MICLLPTSPRKMRNDGEAVTPPSLLNPTTSKGSGESMGKANSSKLSLEERKAINRERCRVWRVANRDAIASYNKQYKAQNKELLAAKKRQYDAKNKKAKAAYNKEYMKQYNANNRQAIAAKEKRRRKENVNYKIKSNLRNRLCRAVRKGYKSGSAVNDLGCSIEFLKENFKGRFYKDENGIMMTWENWGVVWELDHVYPLDAVNLNDRTEFLAVNNWQNLQPLTCKENGNKANTITPAAKRLFNKLVKEFS